MHGHIAIRIKTTLIYINIITLHASMHVAAMLWYCSNILSTTIVIFNKMHTVLLLSLLTF